MNTLTNVPETGWEGGLEVFIFQHLKEIVLKDSGVPVDTLCVGWKRRPHSRGLMERSKGQYG